MKMIRTNDDSLMVSGDGKASLTMIADPSHTDIAA